MAYNASKKNSGNITWIALSLILVLGFIGVFAGGPIWNVWRQGLAGRAKLAEAESSRQVTVLEAKAKFDSAKMLADAEIERAKGVAESNKIIGSSLKNNPEYLQWLYIQGLETGSNNGSTVIYVPTENGLPVPVMSYDRKRGAE